MEKFMKLFAVAVIGMLGVLGWSGEARAITKQCDGCDATAMHQLAYNSRNEMKYSPLYLIDARGGIVRKYVRKTAIDPETEALLVWTEMVAVEPSVVSHIQQAGVYFQPMLDQLVLIPDPSRPQDAQEAISRTDLDLGLSNYIKTYSQAHGLNTFIGWLDAYMGGLFDPSKVSAIIEVVYPDGSTAQYKWDRASQQYKRQPKTSRDKNGNLIPEAQGDQAGVTYMFRYAESDAESYDDFVDMFNRLAGLGVNIIDARSGSGHIAITCAGSTCRITIVQY